MRRRLLALLALLSLAGPALAEEPRCADVAPNARPQNTPHVFVGQTLDEIVERGSIEIAVYEDNAPYSYLKDGKAAGVDVDVGALIAEALGVKPSYRLVQAGENLDADLQNYVWRGAVVGGHVSNLLMRVPYNTDYACRVEQAVLTGQYAEEAIAIAYDKAQYPDNPPKPAFFRFDTVGVENDSISDFYLTGLTGGAANDKIHRYRSTDAAMQALADGEVMAVMGPRSQLAAGLTEGLAVHEPPMPGFALGRWTVGIAVHQSHRDLAYAVDEALATAIADGRIAAIYASHGLPYSAPKR
jgi:ABC-type amino acid transport substrate-binding protein